MKRNDALLDATTSGDPAEATRLLQDIVALERRRNRLVHTSNPGAAPASSPYEPSIPLRDQVIRALQLTGRPSSARLVSDATNARWAERVDTAGFPTCAAMKLEAGGSLRNCLDGKHATSTLSRR